MNHAQKRRALQLGAIGQPGPPLSPASSSAAQLPSSPSTSSPTTPGTSVSTFTTGQWEMLGALALLVVGAAGAGGMIFGSKSDLPKVLSLVGFAGGSVLAVVAVTSLYSEVNATLSAAGQGASTPAAQGASIQGLGYLTRPRVYPYSWLKRRGRTR